MADVWVARVIFLGVCALLSIHLSPFGLDVLPAAACGIGAGLGVLLFEIRLRRASLKRLFGAAAGSLLGIIGAFLISWTLARSLDPQVAAALGAAALLVMSYVGLVVGAAKGELLNLSALGGLFGGDGSTHTSKILDTSVIIDGRIADVAETGFLDGVVVIPQFVLWELQMVADSADGLKRARGRRGLDILQRIQKMPHLDVRIVENDYPKLKEVDQKLIELAKEIDGKILTNDFNLNKLARLQGVSVLNINELANALKPVVLPGETMQVFILKEGKEYNQGVAYLDDGTMVVVDGARRYISKTVEITVTSVLQTTAGKMIFGRFEEKPQEAAEPGRPSARAAASGSPQPPPRKIEHSAR